jgi:dihydrodipicolinate synthase/N-acetylneuraminate lyase
MVSRPLRGVLPVLQTPFHDDESIDPATLVREIDWLYDCGVDGVVVAMVSEILRLSTPERQKLTETVCRANRDRGAVVISVGAESGVLAERFARNAQDQGATAVMAIPPVSIVVLEPELREYYRRIIRSIEIPVIVQDASGYVGRPMSIAMQAELFAEFGQDRVMFKPEAAPIGPRLSELLEACDGEAKVFEGTGGVALVDSFRRGIVGTMPGADLIRGIVALWQALQNRDDARAEALSAAICAALRNITSLDAFLAMEKHLLVRQGIFRNTVIRGPVGYVLDDAARIRIDQCFDKLMAIVEA